jgi:hypothetical protein
MITTTTAMSVRRREDSATLSETVEDPLIGFAALCLATTGFAGVDFAGVDFDMLKKLPY